MNRYLMLMSLCIVPLLQACDVKDPSNKPKTQVRSMIIGGMPTNDHDYKLPEKLLVEDLSANRPQN